MKNISFILRSYTPSDCQHLAELFYQTVHSVNGKDYTNEQLDAWATGSVDLDAWNASLSAHDTVVAVLDETAGKTGAGGPCVSGRIVGFGDMDPSGYLDRLYVHKDYQGQGIATAICGRLERAVEGKTLTVHASVTAKPFFLARGYKVVKKQQVARGGVLLTNYVMEKFPAPPREQ